LKAERLVKVVVQGRHRYYSLNDARVARVLEGLSVLAGGARRAFAPNAPNRLRAARTCYDHIAGALGVSLHDRLMTLEWLAAESAGGSYKITPKGTRALEAIGVDVEGSQVLRRRFAFACLDWSERRPHIGGALGAALLKLALKRRWVTQDLDSRALDATGAGRREMMKHFGLQI
jgi:hypothetical protein